MPELPEVETSRRGIEPYLVNQSISEIIVRQPRLRWPVSSTITQLQDVVIQGVQRRAKYLLLELSYGWLVIHLGMSGSLRILSHFQPAQKHDHIDLVLANGYVLRYNDPRRFGAWLWYHSLNDAILLQNLGPEPLSNDFSAQYLFAIAQRKKNIVKPWLMNNKTVVGVGNIYASESLFIAGIAPQRLTNSLSPEEVQKLVQAVKHVLSHAIQQGGTTLRDFLQSDGKPGYFAQQLQVYGRKEAACYRCGNLIRSQVIAQRNTYFCHYCQI